MQIAALDGVIMKIRSRPKWRISLSGVAATRAALRELEKILDDGMTEETLAATQQFLHNFTINYASTVSRRLAYAVDDAFYGIGGDGYLTSLRPGLAALELQGVNEAIKRNLQDDNITIIEIGEVFGRGPGST